MAHNLHSQPAGKCPTLLYDLPQDPNILQSLYPILIIDPAVDTNLPTLCSSRSDTSASN